MKHMSLFIAIVIILSFIVSCGSGDENTSSQIPDASAVISAAESSDEASEESSLNVSEPEEEPSKEEIIRTWPYVNATFVQTWAFNNYNVKKWEKHCDYLLEAGIDTIIVQSSLADKDGKVTSSIYPCKIGGVNYVSPLLEYILIACKNKGMKVIIGLNNPEDWFSKTLEDRDWYVESANIGVAAAKEIYDLFYEKYSDIICGWYFTPEFYNGIGNASNGAEMLNIYLDGLNEIDPSLPMMMSPFLRSAVSPEETEKEWKEIFKDTHFRKGDIFCCQDSVGAGGIPLNKLDEYFAALKRAVDSKEGLVFWANNEDFTSSGKTANLDRFVSQLEISDKYVENHITFAYSHYLAPDKVGTNEYHDKYVKYYNTGEYEIEEVNERLEYDGAKTLISKDASYSGLVNSRHDNWDDDGIKLTDGLIPSADGNTFQYAGVETSSGATITMDLGKVYDNISEFNVYNAFGNWGINSLVSVTYYVSDDQTNWTKVGKAESYKTEEVGTVDGWILYDFKVVPKESLSGRYIKFELEVSGWIWISELAVYTYDEA